MSEQLQLPLDDTEGSFRATRCLACIPRLRGKQVIRIAGGSHDNFCARLCLEKALHHFAQGAVAEQGTLGGNKVTCLEVIIRPTGGRYGK